MRRFFLSGLAAVSALALASPSASALRIAVMPNASTRTKVLQSEAVVVGKVVGIDGETVELQQHPNGPKAAYTVANIKIETGLVGVKNVTHLKLAFVKPGAEGQPGSGGRPGRPFPGPQGFTPAEDQEGLFFLQKHPTSDNHYVVLPNHPPLLATDAKYKDELAAAKGMVAAFADPVKALKAEKADARMRAANALVTRYRRPPAFDGKQHEQVAIPAEEAKLIFQAMLDADWELWDKPQQPNEVRDWTLAPTNLLGQLQIHSGAPGKGNFPQVKQQPGQGYHAAYKAAFEAWLAGDGKEFEIKRYVQPGEKK